MEQLNRRNNRRPKRKLSRSFLIIFCVVTLAVIGIFTIPGFISDNQLKELGYTNEAVSAINKLKLNDEFIENETYSDLLNTEITETDFRQEDLQMYLDRTSNTDEDWFLYDKLQTIDYSKDDAVKILNELEFFEITPMFVFNNITDLDAYIEDCKNNRAANSLDYFALDGEYSKYYEDTIKVENPGEPDMLINKTYYIDSSYTPELETVSLDYATRGILLDVSVIENFEKMCEAIKAEGMLTYVGSGYRDYDYQSQLFDDYASRYGESEALKFSAKPGHSEHQTGMAVDLVANNAQYGQFANTDEYQWLLEHAHEYGFILRYPENKTQITGYNYESWHWRYLGVELATKVKESQLTYDEYYMLYLMD